MPECGEDYLAKLDVGAFDAWWTAALSMWITE